MRLLIVTPRFLPETGGVETHVYETSRRLAALGVAVTVLCTDASGDLPPHDTIDDVTIRRVRAYPADRDLRLAPAIGRIVREGDWDLVHVQSYHTLVAPHAMLACVRSGTPFVLSFHGGGHSGRVRTLIRPAQQWALRPLLARAARLIALARFEVELYGRRLRLPPERFASVPNGSDLPSLPPGDAPRVDPDLIASVGRLERYKGHHRVIAALPFVLARRPRARLWIAGSGPYRSELERIALRLGVAERVEIRAIPPSERSTMAAELSRAAVVTLLSDFETHPHRRARGGGARPSGARGGHLRPERARPAGLCASDPPRQLAIAHRRRHHRGDEPFRGHSPADHPHVGRLRRAAPRRLPRRPRHRVMRILMVSQFFAPVRGGEERMVEDLSDELRARGHDVAVATTTPTDRSAAGGLRVHRVSSLAGRLAGLHADQTRPHSPPFPDPESVISLRRILAAERPDVVHVHNWLVHSLVPALARRRPPLRLDRSVPCASRQYGLAKGAVTAIGLRPSSAAVLRRVGMCLPISDAVAEGARLARRGVPFEVMPDLIPDRLVDPAGPGSPRVAGLPRGEYIAFAGDLIRDKGIHTLLHAHALLGLAGAIGSLIASPQRRAELGRAAADRARSFRASAWCPGWRRSTGGSRSGVHRARPR